MPKSKRDGSKTKKQQALVRDAVKQNPKLTMYGALQLVKKKFGSAADYYRLRDAFQKAGGTVKRRTGGKGKKAATTSPVKPSGAAAKSSAVKQMKRGPGRPAGQCNAGRRAADRSAAGMTAAMAKLPAHVVIVTTAAGPETHAFTTKPEAAGFVAKLLASGLSAAGIGYYGREQLSVAVRV